MIQTLHHGECYTRMAELAASSLDALITDPPYSSGGLMRSDRMQTAENKYISTDNHGQHADFHGDNRDQRSFLVWATLWLTECHRVLKAGAPVVLFSDWRQLPTMTDALQAAGFVWRGIAVWDKTEGCRPTMGRFASQCEYLVWGSKGPMPLNRGIPPLPGVFRTYLKSVEKQHMTAKPLALLEQVVQIVPPGGVVLDPFAGSGTTLAACQQTGRGFVGYELSAHYVEVARRRLDSYQLPLLAP